MNIQHNCAIRLYLPWYARILPIVHMNCVRKRFGILQRNNWNFEIFMTFFFSKRQFIGRKALENTSRVLDEISRETRDIIMAVCSINTELNSKVDFFFVFNLNCKKTDASTVRSVGWNNIWFFFKYSCNHYNVCPIYPNIWWKNTNPKIKRSNNNPYLSQAMKAYVQIERKWARKNFPSLLAELNNASLFWLIFFMLHLPA